MLDALWCANHGAPVPGERLAGSLGPVCRGSRGQPEASLLSSFLQRSALGFDMEGRFLALFPPHKRRQRPVASLPGDQR